MGEYATDRETGEQVKIGTCEDLLYMRFDQIGKVTAKDSSETDPREDLSVWRFRFPFPDEDGVAVGEFADPFRGRVVHGLTVPDDVEHHRVQLTGHGYVCSIPCPEIPGGDTGTIGTAAEEVYEYRVGRNGFAGPVRIVQQRIWKTGLVTVCECGGCGAKYRLETLEDARPVIEALELEADEQDRTAERNDTPGNADTARRIRLMAQRIEDGYRFDDSELAGIAYGF